MPPIVQHEASALVKTDRTRETYPTSNARRRIRIARDSRLVLLGLLLLILLTACGTRGPGAAIQPSETGNFELRVAPADAQVQVAPAGAASSGEFARSSLMSGDGHGVFRYELVPGMYRLRVTRAGYQAHESIIEFGGEASEEQPLVHPVELQPEPKDDSSDPPAGGDGTDDGSDDGKASPPGDKVVGPSPYSFRADPGFDPSDLSDEQRLWYERLWSAIDHPRAFPDADSLAESDELYNYARLLHTHMQSLLAAFRATGDLHLLDEVDRLAEIMRSQLRDEWRGTRDGTDGEKDGYINWVYRGSGGDFDHLNGKDTDRSNEIKTHAIIATLAYALELNRDLASPSGRDYGAHADEWVEYLREHFEPKWRERTGASGYPVVSRPHTHTFVSNLKYHFYMYRLTGIDDYLEAAEEMADVLWENEIKTVDAPSGDAYVWARSILSAGGSGDYLHPTTYARYVYADFVEFHIEGFDRWASDENMELFARTLTDFVIDPENGSGDEWFASDIGGGRSRAGIESNSDWDRMRVSKFAISSYVAIAPWDASGEIQEVSRDVLDEMGDMNQPRSVYLPAGLLFAAMLDEG